jgi:hypothetical protein
MFPLEDWIFRSFEIEWGNALTSWPSLPYFIFYYKMVHSVTTKTYAERASSQANPAAKRLLQLMDRKQTNLCVSVDVTTTKEVLEIVKAVGPSVCMVKVSYHSLYFRVPS